MNLGASVKLGQIKNGIIITINSSSLDIGTSMFYSNCFLTEEKNQNANLFLK
jgi:hypothetical protein